MARRDSGGLCRSSPPGRSRILNKSVGCRKICCCAPQESCLRWAVGHHPARSSDRCANASASSLHVLPDRKVLPVAWAAGARTRPPNSCTCPLGFSRGRSLGSFVRVHLALVRSSTQIRGSNLGIVSIRYCRRAAVGDVPYGSARGAKPTMGAVRGAANDAAWLRRYEGSRFL